MNEVLITRDGALGRITLNRPNALNALTLGMVRQIAAALDGWETDASLRGVVLDGAGPKAFCAGGDVVALYAAATARDRVFPRQFWGEEYALNYRIATYSKPVVALIHGFCMGGGVGLAAHARHRIVGESARVALPECSIGLVPDVGSTALLAAAPKGIGPWMALTGARLEPRAAIEAGFADAFVSEVKWPSFVAECAKGDFAHAIAEYASAASGAGLPDPALRQVFSAATVPEIIALLATCPLPEAREAERALAKASPLAMATAVALQQKVTRGGGLPAALRLEYRAVLRATEMGDFIEGVRARIITRDNAPQWRHASADQVTTEEVAAQLAPLETGELNLPEPIVTGV